MLLYWKNWTIVHSYHKQITNELNIRRSNELLSQTFQRWIEAYNERNKEVKNYYRREKTEKF